MSTTRTLSYDGAPCANPPAFPGAALYCLSALVLSCAALALAPAGEPAAIGQCLCTLAATLLGFGAAMSRMTAVSVLCELSACLALLAGASAAVMQAILAQPPFVSDAWIGMAWFSGAFSFAAALVGTSRALERLGMAAVN